MNLEEWLEYQQNLHIKSIDLGLKRVGLIYKKLFPKGVTFKVITIAGTNGKGSTGCFAISILNAANISCGWFSSPHIDKYNERFVVNNTLATDSEIVSAFELIESVRGNITLSYFECSTLAALIIFSRKNIDIAVLEVGLGGRLDSVNVVLNNISIITSISFDHTQYLGNTIKKIASEKAGIIKPNTYCIIPKNLAQQARNVIAAIAHKNNTKLITLNQYSGIISMQGIWQQYNANLAQTAVQKLYNINTKTVEKGLKNANIPARAEYVYYQEKTFIFDTAHNTEAVKNLATIIPQRSIAIFAAFKDKDISAMIESICRNIDTWIIFPIKDTRALNNQELQQYFATKHSIACNDAPDAIATAMTLHNSNIIVFGSFLTINAVRTAISR